jgi:hypothetical protein
MYRKYGISREARMPVAKMYRKYGIPREAGIPVVTMPDPEQLKRAVKC